jgi:hypothetical protein
VHIKGARLPPIRILQSADRDVSLPLRDKIVQGGTPGKSLITTELRRKIYRQIALKRVRLDNVGTSGIQL